MKEIPLTKEKFAIVDDADYAYLMQWKWYYSNGYARRTFKFNGIKTSIYMHRAIIEISDELEIDHINGNKLDNRRCNLRACTSSQNSMNTSLQKNNTSGYRGISWHKRANKWRVYINNNNRQIHLGCFHDISEAIRAYNNKAKELFGEFYKPA